MTPIFRSISAQYKLFRQPNKIGDVMEIEREWYVIIGIENFISSGEAIKINYTCQLIKESNYSLNPTLTEQQSDLIGLEQTFHFEDKTIQSFTLGSIQTVIDEGIEQCYKLVEFTEIKLDGPILCIRVLAKEITPLPPEMLKELYKTERKKRLQLTVV